MPKRKLKERITQEAFTALEQPFQDVYEEDLETGEYVLSFDGAGKEKKALDAVRRQLARAESRIKRLVPALAEAKPEDWDQPIEAAAELLEEARELEFDPEEYRRLKDREGRGDAKESEIQKELDDVKAKLRETERESKRLSRELETSKTSEAATRTNWEKSSLRAATQEALDSLKIVPQKRRIVRLLWEDRGLLTREVEGALQHFVKVVQKDGSVDEVPLVEFAKDWAGTDEGREYIPQPDHSGGGDTDVSRGRNGRTTVTSQSDQGGDQPRMGRGREKLAEIFQQSAGQASSGR